MLYPLPGLRKAEAVTQGLWPRSGVLGQVQQVGPPQGRAQTVGARLAVTLLVVVDTVGPLEAKEAARHKLLVEQKATAERLQPLEAKPIVRDVVTQLVGRRRLPALRLRPLGVLPPAQASLVLMGHVGNGVRARTGQRPLPEAVRTVEASR